MQRLFQKQEVILMKQKPFDNDVIIIGANHHNTLAAIRAFGQKCCSIKVIVHGDELVRSKIGILKSKYVKRNNTFLIQNDPSVLLDVLASLSNPDKKPVLFPASDFAEMTIDKNFRALEKRFYLPGFVNAPGKVCTLMDKWNQYLFAQENGIPMAASFLVDTSTGAIPSELTYPCIIKPRVSAFGSKTDIMVCRDAEELTDAVRHYKDHGYPDALVQQFLQKKQEACSLGCVIQRNGEGKAFGGVLLKIREQLESATSFGRVILDNSRPDAEYYWELLNDDHTGRSVQITENEYAQLAKVNAIVLKSLENSGYFGQFDVDYLICSDCVYLNEINYRHSGNGAAMINHFVNAPFMWADNVVNGNDYSEVRRSVNIGSYFMVERSDMMYVKRRVLSLHEWIRDIKRTESFAVYSKKDFWASIEIYASFIIGIIKRELRRK